MTARVALPRLREDLELVNSLVGGLLRGALVYDPLRHQFVRFDQSTAELLSLLPFAETPSALIELAAIRFGRLLGAEDVDVFIGFLRASNLVAPETRNDGRQDWASRWPRLDRPPGRWLHRVVHGYLFFRVPLFSPQKCLTWLYPFLRPLLNRSALWVVFGIGLLGLWLASRQWSTFLGTFQDVFSLVGIATTVAALAFVKTVHELGHAVVAHHYGCRVSSVGVAFMLGVPMLYSDVTDAWRLPQRRDRVLIDAAGVIAELMLGAVALLVWSFLEPGVLRMAAFTLATTSLVMTLVINLNPFMRFDGYHLLVDASGVDNLQPRAFAQATWWFRETLFRPQDPRPEALSPILAFWMTTYALMTWLYRLVLFVGIAVLVYGFVLKLLGIILFLIEIIVFILRPIAQEVAVWFRNRARYFVTRRAWLTIGLVSIIVSALFVPWSTRIVFPVVADVAEAVQIFPPRAARVREVLVRVGDDVRVGDVLAVLEADDLNSEIRLNEIRLRLVDVRLERRGADMSDQTDSLVLDEDAASLAAKRAGLLAQRQQLTVRAPVSGRVLELNITLHPDRWMGRKEAIAVLGSPDNWVVRGYVTASQAQRLATETQGVFFAPESRYGAIDVVHVVLAPTGSVTIEQPMLTLQNGGSISVELDRDKRLKPLDMQLAITGRLRATPGIGKHAVRGSVVMNGTAESIAARFFKRAAALMIRETGF